MKKIGIFAFLILLTGSLFAQLDEGKKMLNYERFQSAAEIFRSMLEKSPKNTDAAYWLGQTYVQNAENLDTAAAKKLYQETLQQNPNDALMIVAVGEIELMEGKSTDARNRFETALNMTKKRDLPKIQLAVARANIDAKEGDLRYAVDLLKQAAERDKKSVDIQIALGDAYRKLIEGGNAVTHYQQALMLDPNAARASFMMGRIYETQGFSQEGIYMNYYYDAIRQDPNFAPVYYWLYMYYYKRDVNKARQYLEDYIAHTDQDSKLCYAQASLLYVSQLYEETIAKADECITGTKGERPFPNLYGLKAYAYDKMNDKDNARKFFEEFFDKVNPDNIGPNDYATYGKVLFQFPGEEALASSYIEKAVEADTLKANKITYITEVAQSMFSKKNYEQAANWYHKLLGMDTANGKVDLFWAGYSDYLASRYQTADSVFKIYQNRYPEDMQGWFLGARANEALDSTGEQGLAKPYWDQVIVIADTTTDEKTLKQYAIPAYQYMVVYYYSVKNDVDSAYAYNEKILVVDPENAMALANKKAFEQYLKNNPKGSARKEGQR